MSRLAPETETNAAVHIHNTSDTRWLRGWLAQIPPRPTDRRLRFPIPSQQLQQPAAQVSLLLPPMSVGAKQLSQYFWLRRGRGWRLQIAIFNMLLQPEAGREGGGLHILFPSDRCAVAEAKNKAENPPLSPL